MNDDEDALCDDYSIQQRDEELEPQPKAIGFLQAFWLPGVIPVSVQLNAFLLAYLKWATIVR